MKENQSNLLKELIIKGTMKQYIKNNCVEGYQVELEGTKFFSPLESFNNFILGEGGDLFKVKVDDDRYKEVEQWIQKNILPSVCKGGSKTLSSYGLKHMIQGELGRYVSNETVKAIMAYNRSPTRRSNEEYPINVYYPYKGIIGISKPRVRRHRLVR